MEEAIGVSPARGYLCFLPTAEENFASNGKTMAGEIEDLEKEKNPGSNAAADDANSIISKRSMARRKLGARVSWTPPAVSK